MAALRRAASILARGIRINTCTFKPNSSTCTSDAPPCLFSLESSSSRFFRSQNPWDGGVGTKRFYYVDRFNVTHFRKRGPRRWYDNPRSVFIAVAVGGGALATFYFGNLETVPYSNRTHFVLLSSKLEREIGEAEFDQIKEEFKGKILPAIHPDSVRVRLIAADIIVALKRGLKKEQVWSDLEYARETHRVLTDPSSSEGDWRKEAEVLNENWIQESRSKGRDQRVKTETSHLDSLIWEILVVDEPVVNAYCLPGGKIVVFTGLLKNFTTDPEIASIIGHEVAHAVGRHVAETITRNFWSNILNLVLYQFITPDVANVMGTLFLKLPFSRKMEIEADYIGLLLMASAGYDPRVAPYVLAKMGTLVGDSSLSDYLSTHPSLKKRAQLLTDAEVMQSALSIYRESMAGRGVEGFL